MYTINGMIEGVAPFLFNRMTELSAGTLEGAKPGKLTVEQRIEDAEKKVYGDERGLYWPAWNLKQVLVIGCRKAGLKEGRQASMAPFLEATVFPEQDPRFDKETYDYLHTVVGRIPPKTGPAQVIRRPALNVGWHLTFRLHVMDDRRLEGDIRTSLEQGGLLVGMGSWRPEYGRFILRGWSAAR